MAEKKKSNNRSDKDFLKDKKTDTENNFKSIFVLVALSSVLTCFTIYFVCSFISQIYSPDIETLIKSAAESSVMGRYGFSPEPVERMQFTVSLLLLPFLLIGYQFILKKINHLSRFYNLVFLVFLLLIFFITYKIFKLQNPVTDKFQNTYAYFHNTIAASNGFLYFFILFPISVFFAFICNNINYNKIAGYVGLAVVGIILVIITYMNIFEVYSYPGAYLNLNPILFPVSQVYMGKSLLVDMSSQYGLFPEFVSVIFKLIGFSVKKFSLVFALQLTFSYLFISIFIFRAIQNKFIALAVFSSLIFMGLFNVKFVDGHDSYFQYWAIRTLFPYMLCAIAFVYTKNRKWFYIYSLAASVAFLWNLDTGLICAVAAIAHILYLQMSDGAVFNYRKLAYTLGKFVAIFVGVILAFTCYIYIKSGYWPDYGIMFKSQQLFYIAGYFMLPMPLIHLWWLVILTYICSMAFGLHKLFSGKSEASDSLYFYLALLGFGIFSYYQGRSHDFNLTTVYYPAFLILGMACDKWFMKRTVFNLKSITLKNILALLFLFVLSISMYSIVAKHKTIEEWMPKARVDKSQSMKQYLLSNIQLLKKTYSEGDSVLILSRDYESIYYAECRLVNPVAIPSSTEVILKKDEEKIRSYIKANKSKRIVVDMISKLFLNIYGDILQNYEFEKREAGTSMCILKPKHEQLDKNVVVDLSNGSDFTQQQVILDTVVILNSFNLTFSFFDNGQNKQGATLLGNVSDPKKNKGFIIQKVSNDSTYIFAAGDGTKFIQLASFPVQPNRLSNVDILLTPSGIKIVVDGVQKFTNNQSFIYVNSGEPLILNYNFNGYIDKVRIVNN